MKEEQWGTCKHENGRFRKLELVDQQILHTLSVVNAPPSARAATFCTTRRTPPPSSSRAPTAAVPEARGCTETAARGRMKMMRKIAMAGEKWGIGGWWRRAWRRYIGRSGWSERRLAVGEVCGSWSSLQALTWWDWNEDMNMKLNMNQRKRLRIWRRCMSEMEYGGEEGWEI